MEPLKQVTKMQAGPAADEPMKDTHQNPHEKVDPAAESNSAYGAVKHGDSIDDEHDGHPHRVHKTHKDECSDTEFRIVNEAAERGKPV